MSAAAEVQCVIVHHRSPKTVVRVVAGAIASGIAPTSIVVVDNSPETDPDLEFPDAVRVLRVKNEGYAAAANRGVRLLDDDQNARPFTLVTSHEAEITPDALASLSTVLISDPSIAAAGPTLLLEGSEAVWSTGGYFSRILNRAAHHRDLADGSAAPQDRDWLDGAFVLYRTDLLTDFQFDESYFLYFEETDLHVRLHRAGHRVVWVPDAVGHQSSSGIPPKLLGRNTVLFQARHFSIWTGRAAVLFEAARSVARKLLTHRGSWDDSRQILSGWLSAERELRGRS